MSFSNLPCLFTCYIFCHTIIHSPLFFTNLHRLISKHPVISHYSHTTYTISYSHITAKCTNTSQIRTQQQHTTPQVSRAQHTNAHSNYIPANHIHTQSQQITVPNSSVQSSTLSHIHIHFFTYIPQQSSTPYQHHKSCNCKVVCCLKLYNSVS